MYISKNIIISIWQQNSLTNIALDFLLENNIPSVWVTTYNQYVCKKAAKFMQEIIKFRYNLYTGWLISNDQYGDFANYKRSAKYGYFSKNQAALPTIFSLQLRDHIDIVKIKML